MPDNALHLGVDVGGTFTDLILYDEGSNQIYVHKLPSTPADPAVAIVQGVREVCALAATEPSGLSELLHGTTVGTNTILERNGARVGMVTTEGFRDSCTSHGTASHTTSASCRTYRSSRDRWCCASCVGA